MVPNCRCDLCKRERRNNWLLLFLFMFWFGVGSVVVYVLVKYAVSFF